MDSEQYMLAHDYRTGRDLVPGGTSLISETDLVMIISKYDDIRIIHKDIKPNQTSVDIYKADLMNEKEKLATAAKNDSNKEECPWKVFLGFQHVNHGFSQLVLITTEDIAKGVPKKAAGTK